MNPRQEVTAWAALALLFAFEVQAQLHDYGMLRGAAVARMAIGAAPLLVFSLRTRSLPDDRGLLGLAALATSIGLSLFLMGTL